jgi:hypothetical protein
MVQVVEHLLSKPKALSSNSSTTIFKKRYTFLFSGRLHFPKMAALWHSTSPIEIGSVPYAIEIEAAFVTVLGNRV